MLSDLVYKDQVLQWPEFKIRTRLLDSHKLIIAVTYSAELLEVILRRLKGNGSKPAGCWTVSSTAG